MSRPLRAGVVGLGSMGRHHVRVLRELDGVELVAVADPDGDRHGAAGGLAVAGSVEEVIAAGVDYCTVAVPTARHEEVALRLAAAGVCALIEKPLAHEVAAAERIGAAFERAGVLAAVGHIERYNPAIRELRRRIAGGALGALHQVSTRRQGPPGDRAGDVGVVHDLATHDLDLTTWVTGERYLSVSAHTGRRAGSAHDDLVAAVAMLSGGVVANHVVNRLSPVRERVTAVLGERGCLVADTLTLDLTLHAHPPAPARWEEISVLRGASAGDSIRCPIDRCEPLRREHEAFRDALLGRAAELVTPRDGLAAVAVAEAVLRSARTGGACALDAGGAGSPR